MTDSACEYLSAHGYPDHVVAGGLERLIREWERVAASVARGEPQEQDDYLNDADGRHILAELWTKIAPEERAPFETRLATADALIRRHLVPTSECIWGSANAASYRYVRDRDWWYYTRPRLVDSSWRTY